MSVHVTSAVWRLQLDATDKLALIKLADCADDRGRNAFPSIATIARECCLSAPTVKRALRRLREAGLIEAERAAFRGQPVVYRVRPERGIKLAPLDDEEGGSSETERGIILIEKGDHPASGNRHDPSEIRSAAAAHARTREGDPRVARAYRAYENCVGTLTPPIVDAIDGWLERADGDAWIEKACTEAAAANARSWRYVEAILQRWRRDGFGSERRRGATRADAAAKKGDARGWG